MRPIPDMITGLRALAGLEVLRHHAELLDDAANYIEAASSILLVQAEQLTEMRVKLEQVRPLMEEAVSDLEQQADADNPRRASYHIQMRRYERDMELPRAIKSMLRWWEPGTAEPASISHWGIVE
jgi:hypothetical protein